MKKVAILVTALALGACAHTPDSPRIQTNVAAPVAQPVIAPMDLGQVHWIVRDLPGLKALVAQMEASGQTNVIFYVLTQDDYNTLAMNLSEMKRFIADQKAANEFLVKAIQTNSQTGATPAKPATDPAKPAETPPKKRFGIF